MNVQNDISDVKSVRWISQETDEWPLVNLDGILISELDQPQLSERGGL
jgi:hypothetical protein